MIFKFDNSLKTDDDAQKLRLARFLVKINEDCHRIDRNGCFISFIEKEVLINNYLGQLEIEHIECNRELFNVTSSNRNDLRCITIGYGSDMYTPDDVNIILNEPSIIVVENKRNDGSVIHRWAECYSDEDHIGDLNQMVLEALDKQRVRFINAGGGNGTIRKSIEDNAIVYGHCPQIKITTVFDSDKSSIDDNETHNRSLIEFLESNNYTYHCLVKREMENYFPIEVFAACGLVNYGFEIPNYSKEEWDYLEIKEDKDKRPGELEFLSYEKKDLPNLSAKAEMKHFKKRVQHQKKHNSHYGEVDEIQHILLKIAKFV